jgi:PAS domain S-box-containing protein
MRAIGRAVRDDAGAIVRLQGAFRDITEQKLAEVESRRLARQLEATLESMTDAVFTLDREWRFSYLNGEAERLLGQPRDALIGKVVWDEFADARGGIFEQNYRRALDEHHMVEFEYHDRPESPWFEFRACPSDDGLTVYFRDITERKASLEKLRESEQRFASIAKATSDTIWECDLVTQKLWWSDSLVSAFGFRPSEMEPGNADPSRRSPARGPADRRTDRLRRIELVGRISIPPRRRHVGLRARPGLCHS